MCILSLTKIEWVETADIPEVLGEKIHDWF